MKIRFLVALMVCFVTATALGAVKEPVRKKVVPTKAKPPVEQPAQQPWTPEAINLARESLPANFDGAPAGKFLEWLREKAQAAKRGEFETSEEFSRRTKDADALLSPLSSQDMIAFRIHGIRFRYDPDVQAYTVGGVDDKGYYSCKESTEPKKWVVCRAAEATRVTDSYQATNSYGATALVQRVRGADLGVAFRRDHPIVGPVFSHGSFIYESDKLPVPLETARRLKGMDLGVLLIGRVTEAAVIAGPGTYVDATVKLPVDTKVILDAVPFDVKHIIYYVVQTGQILARRNVPAP